MTSRPKTPLLDTVNTPDDLRKLGKDQLRQLSDELRAEMIDAGGQTGGHLGSGLGVGELTTAIHYVFNTPEDKRFRITAGVFYGKTTLKERNDYNYLGSKYITS